MTDAGRVVIVGCGHMGLAMVRGLLGARPGHDLVIVETSSHRRDTLSEHYSLSPASEFVILEEDLIVLAIPPQVFGDFAREQRHKFGSGTAVLSVMAGLTCQSISQALGTSQVVRAIPNTPAEVFEGMSVYYADRAVSQETVSRADQLLKAIGNAIRVTREDLVDDATAICGGGPAFVSYLVDAFCQFAASCGFAESAGRAMAVQVFSGTAALIAESTKAPMQLCREVMTPNGTTERGIAALDAAGAQTAILAALAASARRSRELASAVAGESRAEQ